MQLQEAVLGRRSVRKFLSKPVAEEIISDIIAKSLWAPSWGNTQPWEIIVATGKPLQEFKKRNRAALLEGKAPQPDIAMPEIWPPSNKKRYVDLGKSVLQALSIAREDTQARTEHFARMFYLFDAPAVVIFAVDRALLLEYAMLDIGIILQTFCLLAHDSGLGTCIMAAIVSYPQIARQVLAIDENKRLVMGAAFGWPDPDAPINSFARSRGKFEEFVRWVR